MSSTPVAAVVDGHAAQPHNMNQSNSNDPLSPSSSSSAASTSVTDYNNVGDYNGQVEPAGGNTQFKIYWQRWLMLGTFCALSCSNGMAWLTYATVSNYAVAYYNVDYLAINMMAVVSQAAASAWYALVAVD